MKTTVQCVRCDKEMFHYGAEQSEYFCETVRCETEERSENPRQETPQTAPTETQKEKGSVMNKSINHDVAEALTLLTSHRGPELAPEGYVIRWDTEVLGEMARLLQTTTNRLMGAAEHIARHPDDEGALRDALSSLDPDPAELGPEYVANCPDLDDMEHDCGSTRLAHQLTVPTEACERTSVLRLHEVFQHGQQVHALRLEVVDEIHHTAEITVAPEQLVAVAEWLMEKASALIPADA